MHALLSPPTTLFLYHLSVYNYQQPLYRGLYLPLAIFSVLYLYEPYTPTSVTSLITKRISEGGAGIRGGRTTV